MAKRLDRRLLRALLGIGLTTVVWLALTAGLVLSTLEASQRTLLAEQLEPRLALVGLTWLLGMGAIAAVLHSLFRRYASAPSRLLEQTRVLLAAEKAGPMLHRGTQETEELAHVVQALALQRDQLRAEIDHQIALGSEGVQQEKNRLAALMSELSQSVVVCNLDGRIVLYNRRARLQFQTLLKSKAVAGGAELIGIGRSIYTVFDRLLIVHALESVQQRLERGAECPSSQFATTSQSGQLLRVQLAPVRVVHNDAEGPVLSGFVLMLENLTRSFEEENRRDEALHALTQGCVASLASMSQALQAFEPQAHAQPTLAVPLQTLHSEVGALRKRMGELAQQATRGLKTRWPMEEMLGTDLMWSARQRIEKHCGLAVDMESVDHNIWMRVDSYSLTQALMYLSARLVDEYAVKHLRLRLQAEEGSARLDLIWSGQIMSTETAMGWEMDNMQFGAESTALSVQDVVERHGGELIFARERTRHEAFFRFSLPLLGGQTVAEVRPADSTQVEEQYDFDLFQQTQSASALEDCLLSDLSYTVFDTETTGLRPTQGDQIIQIGATRVVNGKLLRLESFEQLVDPKRRIPAATIPIHGISQDMVTGKPTLDEVLPAFHTFAHGTVLVAHNAAFDMKFLQLQQKRLGLVFDHPVLDTLMLSAVVHPNQDSHRLEAIAERFNIPILARHTALGDALVTAEVLLRLIPLLQAKGIHTLGQAREAAHKTYFATLKY